MFREQSFPIHLGSYFAGVGTAVLLVILGWLLLQTAPVAAPLSLTSGRTDVSVSAAASKEILPFDRKLADKGYLALLMNREGPGSPANVHPADRKFFGDSAMNFAASSTGANPLANISPADRKLVDEGYLAILMDRETDAPASPNLANRRLSYEEYVEALRQRNAAR